LLADQVSGKMTIVVDNDTNRIVVKANTDSVNLGYNDTDLTSHTLTLDPGYQALFDDDTRRVVITKMR
jgi:hypothetical protein